MQKFLLFIEKLKKVLFFPLNAVYLTNLVTMKQKMKWYWKLEIKMTFAVSESLARRHLAEIKSQAEKTISVPTMKRKNVQKPSNTSEKKYCKIYQKMK